MKTKRPIGGSMDKAVVTLKERDGLKLEEVFGTSGMRRQILGRRPVMVGSRLGGR